MITSLESEMIKTLQIRVMFHQVNKVINNILLLLLVYNFYLIDCKDNYWIWVADSNVRILSDDDSSQRNLPVTTGTCKAP